MRPENRHSVLIGNRRFNRFAAALAFLPLLASCSTSLSDRPTAPTPRPDILVVHEPSLIPWPAHLTPQTGRLTIGDGTPVIYDSADPETPRIAQYLADLSKRSHGPLLVPKAGNVVSPPAHAIVLRRLADENATGLEGYHLDVTSDGVTVVAGRGAGLFYGAVTLWQYLTDVPSHGVALDAVHIEDAPRFRWRGLLLDSARHFQSPEFVEAFIDAMALHKLNVLQWHLTDDQGWRLEIKRYPRLTKIGAWRVPAGAAAAADIDPRTHEPRLYGGFYTQEQVRRIVRYAAERHITIVPEIEMPGHATAAIVAYPKLGSTRSPPKAVSSDWGVFDSLYDPNEYTFRFLDNVLAEVMALFPSEYIHVGGDEAIKDQWKASHHIQARMRKLGLANEDALQSYFIQREEKFLNAHGRTMIGWDEILEGGVAPNATITSWRGVDGAIAAAKMGHDAVLSPAPDLYFDNRQGEGPDEPPGRGYVLSLEKVYNFDVAPDHLTDAERAHLIGVQANIWTEHIRTEDQTWLMTLPRAAALAEVGWSEHRDWNGFLSRLAPQMARYEALGIPASQTGFKAQAAPPPYHRFSQELELCSKGLDLNLEDDAPLTGPRAIFLANIMHPCWIWRGADLHGISSIEAGVGQVPFNFQIGSDRDKIVFRPPHTPDGELEVHLDTCDGEAIATLPLTPAISNNAVTRLSMPLTAPEGVHDLCFVFTQKKLDPLWLLDWVQLVPAAK
jgi:hexosaminidase